MEFMKDLEDKVAAACQQIEALRKQNRGLKTKVKKLEAELAGLAQDGDWRTERAEVHRRVTKLARGLESLV